MKCHLNRERVSDLRFCRDSNDNEVDLLYRCGQRLVPIAIKSGQMISGDHFKGIDHFRRNFGATGGPGAWRGPDAAAQRGPRRFARGRVARLPRIHRNQGIETALLTPFCLTDFAQGALHC